MSMVSKKVNAILDLSFKIITANEKQEKSACISLDFAKAIDTLNYEILLYKLDYYDVPGIARVISILSLTHTTSNKNRTVFF